MTTKHLLAAACCLFAMSLSACDNSCSDKAVVSYNGLPVAVRQFVGSHFAGEKVSKVIADRDDAVPEYDIILANGTKVEIDSLGSWSEVSNPNISLPVSMIPAAAQAYIADNYKSAKVVKVEKDRKGYDVKLDNGTEVEFDLNGAFLKIDK